MALSFDSQGHHDANSVQILAKTIYRELRGVGHSPNDVMSLASELLGLVAGEVKDRRDSSPPTR